MLCVNNFLSLNKTPDGQMILNCEWYVLTELFDPGRQKRLAMRQSTIVNMDGIRLKRSMPANLINEKD